MRTRLFALGVALTMLVASAFAQTCNNHTVTATITDSDGQAWIGGSFTVTLANPSGGQRPVCRNTGQPITTSFAGTLNGSGALSISLPDTSSVDPPIQWVFTIQSLTSALPSVMAPITLTANVSKTASFSSQVTVPRFTGLTSAFGYRTGEFTAPVLGARILLTNTTPNQCDNYTTSGWASCGSTSGTGSVNPGTAGQTAYYPANGSAVSGNDGAPSIAVNNSTANFLYGLALLNNSVTGAYTPFTSNQFTANPATGFFSSPTFAATGNPATAPDLYQNQGNDIINGTVGKIAYFSLRTYTVEGMTIGAHLSNNSGTLLATLPWSNQPAFGDGLNAVAAGTYPQTGAYNDTGSTITFNLIKCYSDNNGTSTMNVTNSAGTSLLTGAITCSNSWAAGTQSATVTLASGDYLKFTIVADGTSKQIIPLVHGNY